MSRNLIALAIILFLSSTFAASAKTVAAPKGWNDATRDDLRIVSKGEDATIMIYPWEHLDGQNVHDWIDLMELELPDGSEIIKVNGPIKEKAVPGSYTITYELDYGSSKGFIAFYGCPGAGGYGKLMRFDMMKTKFLDLIAGANFGERVCKAARMTQNRDHLAKKYDRPRSARTAIVDPADAPDYRDEETQQQPVAVPVEEPAPIEYDVSSLAKANATIPNANRPLSASSRLTKSFKGYPPEYVLKMELILDFPNGHSVNCSSWDPAGAFPTQTDLHKINKKCELMRGVTDSKAVDGFSPGATIDVQFGNISSVGYDLAEGSANGFSGAQLHMTSAGRISLSKFSSFNINSSGSGAGGGNRSPTLRGHYYLNGYTMTILTDEGEIVHGFIAITSSHGSRNIDHVYINGEHYWDRKKK